MAGRIDAHNHFWRYNKEEYDWIGPGMEALARDFLPADLQAEMAAYGVDGSIAVQARQSLEETDWLLELAASSPLIRGVVGWAPIANVRFPAILEKLKTNKKLKGLRHVVQTEPDDEFILREDFNAGIKALARSGLAYDILIYERHLPAAVKFVDKHPQQIFVLDHLAKPRIKDKVRELWQTHLFELAKRQNVFCKFSGMVTEADWKSCDVNHLRPYADVALEAFGPARVMFGSDWPVCLLASSYSQWFLMAQDLMADLSASEKALVFGGVASKVYDLKSERPAFSMKE